MSRTSVAAGLLLAAGPCYMDSAAAQTAPATSAPVASSMTDYSDPSVWLCWPGRENACTAPQDATIINEDGTLKRETFHAAAKPAIDCFYVYPTVS